MYEIQTFEPSDSAYSAIATLHNAIWTDEPVSGEQLRHEDETWLPGYLYQRLVVKDRGRVIAGARSFENHWQYQPGKYDVELLVHPDFQGQGIGRTLYDQVVAFLTVRTPSATSLVSGTREDQPRALRFLRDREFAPIMRWARSRLDLSAFNPALFDDVLKRVRLQGISIHSIAELATWDSGWQRKAFDLDQSVGQDAPAADPMSPVAFETYVENTFGHAGYLPEGCFAALTDQGEWVGVTELSRTADPSRLSTPWTGVHRNYRRRGISTALKVRAIRFAKEQGTRFIMASNEENNPMYELNLALGFEPLPAALTMKKVLSPDVG